MARTASKLSGASGERGVPEPPPVRGRVVGAVVEPAVTGALLDTFGDCDGLDALGAVPPPPGFGVALGVGMGVAVGTTAVAGGEVGGVVGVGVFGLAVGFGVFVGVTGADVGLGAVVAVGVAVGGAGVGVKVGGGGGGEMGVGTSDGGGGGVPAAAKPSFAGECIARPTAMRPAVAGKARPIVKRLFMQDSLR